MAERIPVLLDTDIGSDIDDAVCLAYLLAQPRCVLAILAPLLSGFFQVVELQFHPATLSLHAQGIKFGGFRATQSLRF